MPGSWHPTDLPNLTANNHQITSPKTNNYNCIAWASGKTNKWWWPTGPYYWPPAVARAETLPAFVAAFATKGFVECADGSLEAGFEKLAIYAVLTAGGLVPTHGARQLPDGKWSSKLGPYEDISHDTLDCVNCPCYGTTVKFMKRPL